MRVRVVSYNVQSFRAGTDPVAAVLTDLDPDLVMLQECGGKPNVARFAVSLGFGVASTHRPFNPVHNAVLFRPQWTLRSEEVRHFAREGKALRRGMIAAQLQQGDESLTAVSTHLGLVPRERSHHAQELTDFLAGVEGPVVVGVDLNESHIDPAAHWLNHRLFDAFVHAEEAEPPGGRTFPAWKPAARIDYVFVNGDIEIHRAWVPNGPVAARASDHLPVVANLEFGE